MFFTSLRLLSNENIWGSPYMSRAFLSCSCCTLPGMLSLPSLHMEIISGSLPAPLQYFCELALQVTSPPSQFRIVFHCFRKYCLCFHWYYIFACFSSWLSQVIFDGRDFYPLKCPALYPVESRCLRRTWWRSEKFVRNVSILLLASFNENDSLWHNQECFSYSWKGTV